ncbi:MAG: tyrosine-type recombinase/integrase [Candidatus Doudnabacteria bacterium]
MSDGIAIESTSRYGDSKISSLLPLFVKHAQYELSFSPRTVEKYEECLRTAIRHVGDLPVEKIDLAIITDLKARIIQGGAGESRIAQIIFSIKSFLRYCSEYLELAVYDYKKIKSPKRSRREVIFLTNEEIEQFVNSIKIHDSRKHVLMIGLRFRVLVEVLLGTGMRISEALSLNRDTVDFEKAEAKIIGKGNKERTVFFSSRSLDWVKYYLSKRKDNEEALFVTSWFSRLKTVDVSKLFRTHRKRAGIVKKLTPHILRHTVATTLLFNGCPIAHVKEILGHERMETTCRYYLGVDKRKAKEAHKVYLNFAGV